MGVIEHPDDDELTDAQLDAMRTRDESPEVAAALPAPRDESEVQRLRRELRGAVDFIANPESRTVTFRQIVERARAARAGGQ